MKGLCSTPSMPASRQASAPAPTTCAVSATTGVRRPPAAASWARMSRVASKPSMSGMLPSMSTMSKASAFTAASAARPSSTVAAVTPSRARASQATSRLTALSSATSTRAPANCGSPAPARSVVAVGTSKASPVTRRSSAGRHSLWTRGWRRSVSARRAVEGLAAGRIAHGGDGDDAARAGGPRAEAHELGGVDDPIGLARDGRHRLRQATEPRGAEPLVENDAGGAAGGRDRDGRRIRAGAGRRRGSGLCLERQQEEELGALPDRARDADLAPHRLDEALADRQPEAGAAEAPRRRLVGLREGGEDRPDLVGRDADAGVADADREAPRLARRELDLQQDMPALGELERVVDEVAQHLRQAHGIAGDLVRHLGCDRGREVEPLRLRALAEQRHDGVDDLGRVDGDALELELARLDLGEVEDVVDDREQALARAGDDLGVAPLPDRQIRRRQELGHDQHAVHRRADLVAHGGEELGLRDVGGFRRLLGLAQIVGAVGDLLLERLAVLLEAMIALADLADHAVEARRQDADLVVALDLDGGAVVVALADGRHGAGERHERRRDRALQPERDHEADRHGAARRR